MLDRKVKNKKYFKNKYDQHLEIFSAVISGAYDKYPKGSYAAWEWAVGLIYSTQDYGYVKQMLYNSKALKAIKKVASDEQYCELLELMANNSANEIGIAMFFSKMSQFVKKQRDIKAREIKYENKVSKHKTESEIKYEYNVARVAEQRAVEQQVKLRNEFEARKNNPIFNRYRYYELIGSWDLIGEKNEERKEEDFIIYNKFYKMPGRETFALATWSNCMVRRNEDPIVIVMDGAFENLVRFFNENVSTYCKVTLNNRTY